MTTPALTILKDWPRFAIEPYPVFLQASSSQFSDATGGVGTFKNSLRQMRGATAPRLILELICGRILLPIGDGTESGLLARIERLERVENIATTPVKSTGGGDTKKVLPVSPNQVDEPVKKTAVSSEQVTEEKVLPVSSEQPTEKKASVSTMDIAGLRRIWPDVIENVKKRRRLTWSLLSASAHIVGVDDKNITIGITNAGARDSFVRSESDEILRQAFIEVVGLDRKIEVVVDPSATPNTPASRAVRVDESPTDVEQLSGAALLARELGAQVITDKK
jgi:DNA polymerase-3 subunit gamma/tau